LSLIDALSAWRELIGDEYVTSDETSRASIETATYLTSQKVPAIIRPASRDELQEWASDAATFSKVALRMMVMKPR